MISFTPFSPFSISPCSRSSWAGAEQGNYLKYCGDDVKDLFIALDRLLENVPFTLR